MNEFLSYFRNSFDYDLAVDRVMEHLIPSLSRKSGNIFKDYWKSRTIEKLFGFNNEVSRARKLIDEEFKSGKREVDVLDGLLMAAQQFFNRPLEQVEIDKLRYLVIDEKVKLRRSGEKIKD
jgi:hypothetical protein